jgi:photosystem II stability/assembly factor-like uncharacterized protein
MNNKSIVKGVVYICVLFHGCTHEFQAPSRKDEPVKLPSATKPDGRPVSLVVSDMHRAWIAYEKSLWQVNLAESKWICMTRLPNAQDAADEERFNSLWGQNSKTVWLISNKQITKSTNGGESWTPMLKLGELSHINNLYFTDDLQGWAIGDRLIDSRSQPVLLHTIDAGQTWEESAALESDNTDRPYGVELYSIFFLNPDVGIISGSGSIWITKDAGRTWGRQATRINGETDIRLSKLQFIDEINGYAAYGPVRGAVPHHLVRTADGGRSWKILQMPESFFTTGLSDFHFVDSANGFAVFQGGLFKTNDGGKSWKKLSLDEGSNIQLVYFLNREHGWVVGNNLLLQTDNGGKTWKK